MNETIASYINILGEFCGRRDIPSLCGQALRQTYGIDQADLMVLFGGSILCGGDLLASAMQQRLAQRYAIVGGAGHTTDTLRRKIHQMYPQIQTENAAEAICFAALSAGTVRPAARPAGDPLHKLRKQYYLPAGAASAGENRPRAASC